MLPLPWHRSPVSFVADRPNFIFQLAAPDMIWHIYSHLYCSSRNGGRDLPSSGEAAPTMGQVPCEFRADQPEFSFFRGRAETRVLPALPCPGWCNHQWPVAPDMIWHIYSHLYCSSRDGGRDLPSSGEAAPTMGQVPCEFWADWPNFIFQQVAPDMIWHILLWAGLLQGGFRYGPSVFRGCCSHHGADSLWVSSRNCKIKSSC